MQGYGSVVAHAVNRTIGHVLSDLGVGVVLGALLLFVMAWFVLRSITGAGKV